VRLAFEIIASVFLTACLRSEAPPERIPIIVSWAAPDTCRISFAGLSFDLPRDDDRMTEAFKRQARKVRAAYILAGDPHVPYKCVGPAIIEAQRAGIVRIGFIAEPPPTREVSPQ